MRSPLHSSQGYGTQAEGSNVSGQRKQSLKRRPANTAGFEGQDDLEEAAAEKEPSKIA